MDSGAGHLWSVVHTMIEFMDWLPDQPQLNNKGVTIAENVIPMARGYRSLHGFEPVSNAATGAIRGIFAGKDNTGIVTLFAGDDTKLYKYNSANNNLVDSSKSGGYALGGADRWRFVQFGDKVLVAGGSGEELQKYQLGVDTAFSDLSVSAPKADFIAVVRDQVWVASIDEGSGKIPFRTRWSAINDETGWTVGTDQSDFQDIFGGDAGAITGLVGGEFATILMERGIAVAQYVGSPLIYQIDMVETSRGCKYKNSVANIGKTTFFISDDGFFSFDGRGANPIGAEKVNRWWMNDVDTSKTDKMSAAVDPINQIVCWSYVSNDSTDGEPDKMIIYHYVLGKWSIALVQAELIAPFFTSGVTMEGLDNINSDMDSITGALDSIYRGGSFLFGGAYNSKIYAFNGDAMDATIETAEFSLAKDRHTVVTRTVPAFEISGTGSVTMSIGSRDRQDDPVVYSTASALTDEGFCQHRVQARFHRFKMQLTDNWQKAFAVDVEGRPLGRR